MWIIKTAIITLFFVGVAIVVVFTLSFGFVLNCSSIAPPCAELVSYFRTSIDIFVKVYVDLVEHSFVISKKYHLSRFEFLF